MSSVVACSGWATGDADERVHGVDGHGVLRDAGLQGGAYFVIPLALDDGEDDAVGRAKQHVARLERPGRDADNGEGYSGGGRRAPISGGLIGFYRRRR